MEAVRGKKKIILGVAIAILVVFLTYFFQKQSFQLDVERIKEFVRSLGIFGSLALIFLMVISIVFAPLAVFPFWVASLALYGFGTTLISVILANNLGAAINFWLARRFGQPLVIKLVGKKGIEKIDEIAETVGLQTLIIWRFLGGVGSDYLSYAAGLTLMKFKLYFLISFFATLPMVMLNLFIIHKALTFNPLYFLVLIALGYILAIGFPLMVYKRKQKI